MAQTCAQTPTRIKNNVTCKTGRLNVDLDKKNMNVMHGVRNINTCKQFLM